MLPTPALDRLASPPWWEWGEPGGAVVAWVATHVTATTVFLTVIVTSPWDQPWRQAIAYNWAVLNSALVIRLAIGVALGDRPFRGQTLWQRPDRVASPDQKTGVYFAATMVVLTVVGPLGAPAVAAFGATLALTLGARTAGLDAWERVHRPTGYYVARIVSWRTVGNAVAGVVAMAATMWLLAVVVDPSIDPRPLEELLEADLSRRGQFVQILVSFAVFTPPAIAVAEAISAVARFQRGLEEQLVAAERSREREYIAQVLHDSALSITGKIFRTSSDPEQRRLVAELEGSLRALRNQYDVHRRPRRVGECLRRALLLAQAFEIHVDVQATGADLRTELPADAAAALEHLALVVVGNSGNARATSAVLRTETVPGAVDFTYYDDGAGFDPDEAMSRQGGLHDVAAVLSELGATIRFATQIGRTVTHARIPT